MNKEINIKIIFQAVKKKSWAVQFKEFRAYGECVLDYLRSQVLLHLATLLLIIYD